MTHSIERFTKGPGVDAEGFELTPPDDSITQASTAPEALQRGVEESVNRTLSDEERAAIQADSCERSPSHAHRSGMGETRSGQYEI